MKKIITIIGAGVIGCIAALFAYNKHVEKRRILRERNEELLRKEGEYLYRKALSKQQRDEQFIKDLQNGRICKMFYYSFKDLFDFPELPEGYIFPEDQE